MKKKIFELLAAILLLLTLILEMNSLLLPTQIYSKDQNQLLLVDSYLVASDSYDATAYKPRQSPYREHYANWDWLSLAQIGHDTITGVDNYLTVKLNRPAKAVIIWKSQTSPKWLSTWKQQSNSGNYKVYAKTLRAGNNILGANYEGGADGNISYPLYDLLLAEAGGRTTPAPTQPAGLPPAQPNQPCPSWLEAQFNTTGPDGKTYSTYHPQIDKRYWCYYGHEHGSDPALFDAKYRPAFGYVAAQAKMNEPNNGFKDYVFDVEGYRWLVSAHIGTSLIGRVCTRFHEVQMAVKNIKTGELMADVRFMADFGKSLVNTTSQPYIPANCPNQAQLVDQDGSNGIRIIGSAVDRGIGYEAWRLDEGKVLKPYFNFHDLTFWNGDARTLCSSVTCDRLVDLPNRMLHRRTIEFYRGSGFDGTNSPGAFYTDVYGKQIVSSTTAGAIYQYIKPGWKLNIGQSLRCKDFNGWDAAYDCYSTRVGDGVYIERENSIGANSD